jgi:SAM-dependent methyltransferase
MKWEYDALPSRAPYDWSPATRGDRPWDSPDFHLDLGCGRVPKGRMGIDLRPSPGATDLAIDFETLLPTANDRLMDADLEQLNVLRRTEQQYLSMPGAHGYIHPGLPFTDGSIRSIITHHSFEHVGPGFERLMEECYRVLAWDGIMRIIVPLFPSYSAVSEYDHKRYFMVGTMMGFCQEPEGGPSMTNAFSERYNSCCFRMVDEDYTPSTEDQEKLWTPEDGREIRTTLWKHRPGTPGDHIPAPEDYS